MAIHDKFLTRPGQCIRCGLHYQSGPDFFNDPELCDFCKDVVNRGIDTEWKKGAFTNANHPKK